MQKIIGICGLKGSGKDTIANIICEKNSNFITLAFADAVKDIASIMFQWDRQALSGRTPESREWREKKDEYWSKIFSFDFTPRNALTTIGTDIVRNTFLHDIWKEIVKKKIIADKVHDFVITDARFPNEINMIKELGGIIIQVERGEKPEWWNIAERYNTIGSEAINNEELEKLQTIHPSERDWIGMNNPDYIIKNDGTIDELQEKVFNILNK